ncbi:MAG: hypothetical protein WKF96_23985 [Solirubrobacteraceae bacterium]
MLTWHLYRHGIRLSRFPVEPDATPEVAPRARVSTRFSLSPRRFRVRAARSRGGARLGRASRGALVRLGLRAPAKVVIRIERRIAGAMRGGDCRPARRRSPRRAACIDYVSAGALKLGRRKGAVRRRFGARIDGRPLRPGRYRAVVTTRAGQAPAVRERRVDFTVVGR